MLVSARKLKKYYKLTSASNGGIREAALCSKMILE
jgi:hypothetical protein